MSALIIEKPQAAQVTKPPVTVAKGDIQACIEYSRWYAEKHNVSLRYARYCVFPRFIDWSFPEKKIIWWQS